MGYWNGSRTSRPGLEGDAMAAVKFFQGPMSTYVDDREVYLDTSSGQLRFKDDFTSVAEYVAATEVGRPLNGNERIFFRDGNKANVQPDNLFVAERERFESWQAFYKRVDLLLEGRWRRSQTLSQRVKDLHKRKLKGSSTLPLYTQIAAVQQRVDEVWLKKVKFSTKFKVPFNMEEVVQVAKNAINFQYIDVKIEDIILDEQPNEVVAYLKAQAKLKK